MNNNLIAYYRVSTKKQEASGLGLEGQQAAVAEFAQRQCTAVLATYTEKETGKRANRPEPAKAIGHRYLMIAPGPAKSPGYANAASPPARNLPSHPSFGRPSAKFGAAAIAFSLLNVPHQKPLVLTEGVPEGGDRSWNRRCRALRSSVL
jgi:hypothetical protein